MPKTCFVNEAGKCQLAPLSSCAAPSLIVYLWVKERCFSTIMQWFPVGCPLHLHFISKMSNGMPMRLRSHFSYSHCSSWRHAWNRDCELELEEITFLSLHSGRAKRLTYPASLGPVSGGRADLL